MTVAESSPALTAKGTWVIDLDGVIWLAGEPIRGSSAAIGRLRAQGARVLFASNNSAPTVDGLLGRLARAGVAAEADELVTSAQAMASMVPPGSTALAVADEGVTEALTARGVTVVHDGGSGPVDVVVVGWTRHFDFDRLAVAARAVRQGARLIGTNDDPTYPTPEGLLPGGGSLLAAVATAGGVEPDVAGKPHPPMAALVAARAGDIAVVVGDRPSTDGLLARQLGAPFALVLSGVTSDAAGDGKVPADLVADDLGTLVAGAFP